MRGLRFLGVKQRLSFSDGSFHVLIFTFLLVSGLVILYPLIYVVSCSLSSTQAIIQGKVVLWPVEFSTRSYSAVLEYGPIMRSFLNSLFYVAGGTTVAVILILLAAYPMSRRDMPGRKILQTFYVITMFFGGGLIPGYILMRNLHLVGSRWSLVIGVGFSCYNMIIVKSYFQSSIPSGLLDAAHIDGCGDVKFFLKIALPLAAPVIAVMVLFNAVGIWNGYFGGILYLTDPKTYTFSMILREILFIATIPAEMLLKMDPRQLSSLRDRYEQLRYAVLVVGALPMMVLYPFVQKYFIRGLMIGSLKE
jgi:multiple sugar transport system permease protein/putative aldouronate transport system permease protein